MQSTPIIELLTDTLCDGLNENYQFKVKVVSGTTPYRFEGVTGTFEDSIFTSDLITSGANYTFQVRDENNCQTAQLVGQHHCLCSTNAGTLDSEPIVVCGSETAQILPLNDAQLDENDQLIFVLHDGANGLGNILATSTEGIFTYTEELNINQRYYVSPVAGSMEAVSYTHLTLPTNREV